ncbi:Putative Arrestin (Or S-antigen), N-terminal domain protein [Aspergillus calidoustus]|uniref:Putative Arrestin (Or S-antigen), N-terminal domain protein n=1 Tax=Aspergillus calidoustus TaxID=454130 RepID=A0A0U5FUW7_ASPCI|nr:Putative Arrestin (Or S-antigen), N-terminal domain protein [Aspergillus calidoustus]
MPGRLLSNLVRPSVHHHSIFPHSNSSSTSSVNEVSNTQVSSKKPSANSHERPQSPERRLSFSMDHFIHTYRDHNKEKRRNHGRSARSKERAGHVDAAAASAKLDVIVESPPLVCYGTPANSTGALFSGRLRVSVPETTGMVTLDKFDMHLMIKRTTKKPVSRDCPNCASRTEELTNWNFLTEPRSLKGGDHDFPFSYLFPGNLPASCNGSLGQVEYFLQAHAHNVNGEDYNFKMPLHIKRAILPSNDKSSIRIFPPTNLTGRIVLPSVVHPIGTFPVQMTLSGVLDKGEDTQTRWRLRKMMWRIEEHQKIVSTACAKHAHKIGGEGKGVLHQETRIIGHNEEKDGWKTDFDTAGGEITMEFEASINPTANPVCDLESSNGLESKHNLVIELIVAEEFCPNRNTKLITPTGAARVLRMQFNLHVTERSGLGISWDEEMPPVYEDVPASPPGYTLLNGSSIMEDYQGSPLPTPEYEELERMDSLRLDHSSTHSSARGRARLTTDDLITEPAEIATQNRAPSADSGSS